MSENEKDLDWIYLMTSNYNKEYVLDVMETLALPFGVVQHFRYQLIWLDLKLKNSLPEKDESKKLSGKIVVLSYLYQEKKDKMEWHAVYPIRTGIIKEAYKTGNSEKDVAHFYFEVREYIKYDKSLFHEKELQEDCFGEAFGSYYKELFKEEKFGEKYAVFCPPLDKNFIVDRNSSKTNFHAICEAIEEDHLKNSTNDKTFYPIFCFIEGIKKKSFIERIKKKNGKYIEPKYNRLSHQSYYNFNESSQYFFEFITYSKKQPRLTFHLLSNEKIFSTPEEYELKVNSRYDEASWTLISSILDKDIQWTLISFKAEETSTQEKQKEQEAVDKKVILNMDIRFPIKIKRNRIYRIIDYIGEVGFGIGTGAIALSKILENWEWWHCVVIGGYFFWAICKLIIKFWRG